jgi:hypothetical protein
LQFFVKGIYFCSLNVTVTGEDTVHKTQIVVREQFQAFQNGIAMRQLTVCILKKSAQLRSDFLAADFVNTGENKYNLA